VTTMTETNLTTVQVYRVYIRATPEAIWDAITKPEWTDRYGYQGRVEFDLRAGGAFQAHASAAMAAAGVPDLVIVGEVLEADPPRKLVQTWHPVWSPEAAAETPTRLTYEIEAIPGAATKLTVTHDVEGAPSVAAIVSGSLESQGAGGGWAWVLSDLKTLLETGEPIAG
jgi:uncharacterized protein YndB with AHSA1/START domain